jgi:hypothetical protein
LVSEILGSLLLEKHPDKTFIGRIERGFDFLGYHFTADSLTLSDNTLPPQPNPRGRHPGQLP